MIWEGILHSNTGNPEWTQPHLGFTQPAGWCPQPNPAPPQPDLQKWSESEVTVDAKDTE
jgi:hypothetical protein